MARELAPDPDPWGSYYFSLELNGVEVAHFMECSGLKSSASVFEIEEGGYNGNVHRRTGQSRWDNIVLKTATNVSMELLEWRDKYLQDDFTTRSGTSGSIVMYDNHGIELRRFNFVSAWPVGWEGPQLQAGGSALAIETLELAHEGIYIDGEPPPPEEPPPRPEIPPRLDLPPVQFEYDSDVLTPKGREVVAEAARQLDEFEIEDIWIEGHTCTMGSFAYNQSLSNRRAAAVVKELKKQSSNPARRYMSMGFAWKYPTASNATLSGKEANRRTEFMTSSWNDRGMNADPIVPESRKYGSPWFHA